MALTYQLVKELKQLATQMQYYSLLGTVLLLISSNSSTLFHIKIKLAIELNRINIQVQSDFFDLSRFLNDHNFLIRNIS
tara:strand:+ start:209 stop:445 length:237 start_codon:yes stop_codon:yes gene_type:complete